MFRKLNFFPVFTLFFIGCVISCTPPVNEKPRDPRTFSASDMDLLEMGYTLPYFADFMYSLEKTKLIYLMEDPGPYTVFAPVQESFVRFREKHRISHLDQFSEKKLAEVMLYHFIPGKWSLEYIPEGYYPTLLAEQTTGNPIDLYIDKKSVIVLNGTTYIDEPDLGTVNGYIHSIHSVMEIPAVMDHLSFNIDFSLFYELLNRQDLDPDLKNLLSDADPITIFAPTNKALETFLLEHPVWHTVSDIPARELNEMIYSHLIDHGNIVLSQIQSELILSTAGGNEIKIQVDYPKWKIQGENRKLATILIKDIQALNGIIHQIDQVMLP